jgi:hypothetical protein
MLGSCKSLCLKRFRNYYGLIKIARCGFPWKKTTKRAFASVYTNCETALAGSDWEQDGCPRFPRDFLWSLLALANLIRLSLLKAAHAVMDGARYRKSGSPQRTWAKDDLFPMLSPDRSTELGCNATVSSAGQRKSNRWASPNRFQPTYAETNVGHPSRSYMVPGMRHALEGDIPQAVHRRCRMTAALAA